MKVNEEFRSNYRKTHPLAFEQETQLAAAGNLRYHLGTVVDTDWVDGAGQRHQEQLTVSSPAPLDSEFVHCSFFLRGSKYDVTRYATDVTAKEGS